MFGFIIIECMVLPHPCYFEIAADELKFILLTKFDQIQYSRVSKVVSSPIHVPKYAAMHLYLNQ